MISNNPYRNDKGYPDPTAGHAIKKVHIEEQDAESRFHFMIKAVKFIIRSAGFDLIGRIEVRDRKTGKEYR